MKAIHPDEATLLRSVIGELPERRQADLSRHVSRCRPCSTNRAATRRLHEKMAAAGDFLAFAAGDVFAARPGSWSAGQSGGRAGAQAMKTALGRIEGEKERLLIRIPEWDYNWQEQYELKVPLKLPKGTILKVRATFDNSKDNPNNPTSPPKDVRFGEQTTDEMCFVFLGIASKSPIWRLLIPDGPPFKN